MPNAHKTWKTLIIRILEEERMIKIAGSLYKSLTSDCAFSTRTNPTSTMKREMVQSRTTSKNSKHGQDVTIATN